MEWNIFFRNPFLYGYVTSLFGGAAFGIVLRYRRRVNDAIVGASLLLAVSLLAFSLGTVLVEGFPEYLGRAALLLVAGLCVGILSAYFPKFFPPLIILLLFLLYGNAAFVRARLEGVPLHQGPVELTVLRTFDEGGGSLEFRHQGESMIFRTREESLRFAGLSVMINPKIPWPHADYIYLYLPEEEREGPDGGGVAGRTEGLSSKLASLILRKNDLTTDPIPVRLLRSFQFRQKAAGIEVRPLFFPE